MCKILVMFVVAWPVCSRYLASCIVYRCTNLGSAMKAQFGSALRLELAFARTSAAVYSSSIAGVSV